MATKVKGITIELGADTSGLEKALKSANQSLSSTQKQLTAVNKALKLDPGNTDLLEQKQRKLASAIEQTANKLKALKQAQAQIGQSEGTMDQYDALTLEISATESKLKTLNQEQQAFNAQAQLSQGATSAFASGLSSVGNAANMVAAKTAALSAAAAAALGGMMALAVSASQTADEWLTLSSQTGLATDSIQKFAYAAEQIDVPLPTITQAITQLKRHLDDTSGIWDEIGVKVKNQDGSYRDIESIFNECVQALGGIENETERDEKAMKLFGKSANELAGLIDDGGQKMRELGKEAESMGLIIPEEDLQKLGEFNDLLEATKSKMGFAAMKAALPVLEALAPLINVVVDALNIFAQMLEHIPTPIVTVVATILIFIAALAPVAMVIGTVCNGISALIGIIPAVISGISAMSAAMTAAFASNPALAAILAIIVVLGALTAAIMYVVSNWDQFKAVGLTVALGVKQAFASMGEVCRNAAESIKEAFSNFPDIGASITGAVKGAISAVTNMVTKIIDKFNELKEKARHAGSDVLNKFTEGVQAVISKVTQAFQRLAQAISNVFSGMERDATMSGSRVGNAFTSSYNNSMNNIRRPTVNGTSGSSYSGGRYSSNGATSGGLSVGAVEALMASRGNTNVTVELVGSAKNIFDTVRVQNNVLATATGYHALA